MQMVERIFVDNFWCTYWQLPDNVRSKVITVDKSKEEQERCWDKRTHIDILLEDKYLGSAVKDIAIWNEKMLLSYSPN